MPKVGLNLAFLLFNFDSLPCRIKEKSERYLVSQILTTHYHINRVERTEGVERMKTKTTNASLFFVRMVRNMPKL
jgi:hypothetical protein